MPQRTRSAKHKNSSPGWPSGHSWLGERRERNVRPEIITGDHLARLAAPYGRQSTPGQVERNTGSTDYQRAQAEWARRWGWVPERIVAFEDFGLTGAAALHRPAYQALRERIRRREIGCVLVSDITRLGRDTKELLDFIRDCNIYNVLIAVDGKIQNLNETRSGSPPACSRCWPSSTA